MIKLIYYRGWNFGDKLSKFIVEKISGESVLDKNTYNPSFIWQIKTFLKCLFLCNRHLFNEVTWSWEHPMLGIGSILSKGNSRSIVWGSGFMNKDEIFRGGKVYALRGKLSNQMLRTQGYYGTEVFGDPALLLPLFISPSNTKAFKVSFVPHFSEYNKILELCKGKYNVIDLHGTTIEEVVKQITSSEYVLSTSLHGIIVAHAYGIPALWVKYGYIETDGTKFYDYFSSVDIPKYEGGDMRDLHLELGEFSIIDTLFRKYKTESLPVKKIGDVQKGLIESFPYKVKDKKKLLELCDL